MKNIANKDFQFSLQETEFQKNHKFRQIRSDNCGGFFLTPTISQMYFGWFCFKKTPTKCKRTQQLPTMLGPAVHRRKDTTHKFLETMRIERASPQ